MSNRISTEEPRVKAHRQPRWLLSCVTMAIVVPALVFAAPITMQVKSALYWMLGGQTLIVTVAEVGDTAEASLVSIEIRDSANVVRASALNKSLTATKPVVIAFTVPGAGLLQLRTVVTPTILDTPEFHQPTVSMEVFDPKSLTIKTLPPCAIPMDQMPSTGSGAEGNCGGWHVPVRTP